MNDDKKTESKGRRKEYRKPRLVRYGDLGSVTRAEIGGSGDFDGQGAPPLLKKSAI